jgi:hypothetical protein
VIGCALATAYVLLQRFDDAKDRIARSLAILEDDFGSDIRAKVFHHVAWVALFTGDVVNAKTYAHLATAEAVEAELYEVAARALSVEQNIAHDIDDANTDAILEWIYACGVRARNMQVKLYALLGQIDAAAERGDALALEQLEHMLQSEEFDYGDEWTGQALVPAQALAEAGRGNFRSALDLLVATGDRQSSADRRVLRNSEIALFAAASGLHEQARASVAAARAEAPAVGLQSHRVLRASLNLAVAHVLLGEDDLAAETLAGIEPYEPAMSERLRVYARAVRAVCERYGGAQNHGAIHVLLAQVRSAGFGGLAAVLASLPIRTLPQEQFA